MVVLELRAYLSCTKSRKKLQYWRSKSQFEVDFIVGESLAIEVKSAKRVSQRDHRGLKAISEEKNGLIYSWSAKMKPQGILKMASHIFTRNHSLKTYGMAHIFKVNQSHPDFIFFVLYLPQQKLYQRLSKTGALQIGLLKIKFI